MFNPLTKESYTQTVESWAASFFALLSLLPRHPDIQRELALPVAPAADGGQVGPPALSGGGSGAGGGALGRRGGDGVQPDGGAAAGQQPQQQQQAQQADGAGGTAVRAPSSVQAAGGGAASGTQAAGAAAGDGSDGSSADKALEIASALREHMQQQDGGEAAQQGQQGGAAVASSGQGWPEPLGGERQQSGVAAALYWLTLAAVGALDEPRYGWKQGGRNSGHAARWYRSLSFTKLPPLVSSKHGPTAAPCCRLRAGQLPVAAAAGSVPAVQADWQQLQPAAPRPHTLVTGARLVTGGS